MIPQSSLNDTIKQLKYFQKKEEMNNNQYKYKSLESQQSLNSRQGSSHQSIGYQSSTPTFRLFPVVQNQQVQAVPINIESDIQQLKNDIQEIRDLLRQRESSCSCSIF
ncbi:hypothetical protein ABPG74_008288 [Tetrahymena malaccensis]